DVAVESRDAPAGKELGERLLEPLRAAPEGLEIDVAAVRTRPGHRLLGGTMMADEPVARRAPGAARRRRFAGPDEAVDPVQHAVRRAVRATAQPAAGGAGEHRRIPPPVDEDERLLAARDRHVDRLDDARRERMPQLLPARIDALDDRQGRAADALVQRMHAVAA